MVTLNYDHWLCWRILQDALNCNLGCFGKVGQLVTVTLQIFFPISVSQEYAAIINIILSGRIDVFTIRPKNKRGMRSQDVSKDECWLIILRDLWQLLLSKLNPLAMPIVLLTQ